MARPDGTLGASRRELWAEAEGDGPGDGARCDMGLRTRDCIHAHMHNLETNAPIQSG